MITHSQNSSVGTYPRRKGGVIERFYCGFYSANFYAVSANGQKMVQKRHSDVYRIETTIKHDINVFITPLSTRGMYICMYI
jgi:hypothetical protein